ncbi:MAG: hypothetical protein K2J58_04735 [Muribaculaceae bacterium]|nr:hypothetical protein [Muribaculaceae bacterium]
MENKKRIINNSKEELNKEIKRSSDVSFIDPFAPFTVLSFKAGSLHADFSDCLKFPGIYGSLWTPIQLLDVLKIENGMNASDIRFAAQFSINQMLLDRLLSMGMTFTLSSNLSFIDYDDT